MEGAISKTTIISQYLEYCPLLRLLTKYLPGIQVFASMIKVEIVKIIIWVYISFHYCDISFSVYTYSWL